MQIAMHDSPGTLVLWCQRSCDATNGVGAVVYMWSIYVQI